MRTTILFAGIFIIFGSSCIVRGDTGPQCQKLVYYRAGLVFTQCTTMFNILSEEMPGEEICRMLEVVRSAEETEASGCEEDGSSQKTLLAKLNKKKS